MKTHRSGKADLCGDTQEQLREDGRTRGLFDFEQKTKKVSFVHEKTLGLQDLIKQRASQCPSQVYLEDARSNQVVTCAELADATERWRGVVADRTPGVVALAAPHPLDFAVAYLGLMAAGATVAPLDALAPVGELRSMIAITGATAVVTTEATLELPPGIERWSTQERSAQPAPDGDTAGAALMFSSGSTGPRKAIRLTEAQLLHTARTIAAHHLMTPSDRCFNSLPLFHINAQVVGLLANLVAGSTLVLEARFHRRDFWELMEQRRITWANAVPAILAILATAPPVEPPRHSLRFVRSASAPLPVAVLERFESTYGVPVIETYGMTEAGSQITANPLHGPRKRGSVGLPTGVQLRILGAGAEGEVGTVQLRGPGVITSYATSVGDERFDADGWLDTGDEGYLDTDGHLFLVGRKGDVINRGGEKIFPREVEEVLQQHPDVRQAAVVGRSDDVLGQLPIAYVVIEHGDPHRVASELAERARTSLARFKQPTEVHVVGTLPAGPTGKVTHKLVAEHDTRLARTSLASAAV